MWMRFGGCGLEVGPGKAFGCWRGGGGSVELVFVSTGLSLSIGIVRGECVLEAISTYHIVMLAYHLRMPNCDTRTIQQRELVDGESQLGR